MIFHLYHGAGQGKSKAFLRSLDSDVVVPAINIFQQLRLSELWIGFGTEKTYKDIPIHHIFQMLGPQRCEVLPFFHAFTGCDVASLVSAKRPHDWNAYLNVNNTFVAIIQDPSSLTLDPLHMRRLERWTVIMYIKNCDSEFMNDARKLMKSLDSIPPTQHAKRALITGAFIWKQSLSKTPNIPKPSDWGWEWNTRTNQWLSLWTDLSDASRHACSLLLHCGCVGTAGATVKPSSRTPIQHTANSKGLHKQWQWIII